MRRPAAGAVLAVLTVAPYLIWIAIMVCGVFFPDRPLWPGYTLIPVVFAIGAQVILVRLRQDDAEADADFRGLRLVNVLTFILVGVLVAGMVAHRIALRHHIAAMREHDQRQHDLMQSQRP